MRALLFTASGHRNLWDELILAQEAQLLREIFPGIELAAATYDPSSVLAPGVETVGYFPHALRRRPLANILTLFATIREIWRADMVVFGGGGLIYDNEPGQSYAKLRAEWLVRVWLARLLRRPIYWCAVGVYVSPEHARSLRPLFAGPGIRVSVRDSASLATLASIGVAATLVPDPVHLYRPAPHVDTSDGAPRLVGLALRSGYARDDATLVRGLVLGLRARGYEPVFASHSLHGSDPAADDLASCLAVARELGVAATASMVETLALYPRLHAMVSMRLHASILSFVHALPFVAVSYSTKTHELLDAYGYGYRVPAATATADDILAEFDRLMADSAAVRLALARDSDTMRETTYRTLKRFFTDGLEEAPRGSRG